MISTRLPLLAATLYCFASGYAAPIAKPVQGKALYPKPKVLNQRQQTLKRAADLILANQGADGSIAMGARPAEERRVVPYFSNIAALGLVDAYRELGDPRYLVASRQWIGWYDAHRNSDGTIFDYTGGPGKWQSTQIYDSTDSYAATYMLLVLAIHRTEPDTLWLKSHLPFVEQSIKAVQLTLQPNDLTTANPKWPVMYTMDNIEVLFGLRSATELFKAAGHPARAAQLTKLANANELAIKRDLWMADKSFYRIGIQTDGGKMEGMAKWYPDIMANAMAVAWLPKSRDHVALYHYLKSNFPKEIPNSVGNEDDLDHLTWWGLAAKGADDTVTLAQIKTQLNGFDAHQKTFYNVALLGHICHLLSNNPAIR